MASEKIPFGFGLPQVSPTEPVDIEPIGRVAQRAEALGFQSLWTLDQVLGGSRNLEPIQPSLLRRGDHDPRAAGDGRVRAAPAQPGAASEGTGHAGRAQRRTRRRGLRHR